MAQVPQTARDSAAHVSLPNASLGRRLIERIGNTPLVRVERVAADFPQVELLGKAEWYNPGGSVKDRAASNIIAEGRRTGKFSPGKTLLDSTSGNTGIAYAMLGAAEGFPVTLCVPENVSAERKRILQAYGANILYTDPAEVRTARFDSHANLPRRIPIFISTRTSIRMMQTGVRIIKRRPTRFGNRRTAA